MADTRSTTADLAASDDVTAARSAISVRSVVGGALLVMLLSIATPFSEYRLHSVELFQGELPLGALATLVVILLPL